MSGEPRVQYKRTVLVVPQVAERDQWQTVCKEAYDRRQTVGFSYDDAGIGALDDKTAVLYGIAEDQKSLFKDWYGQHYPGTQVEFRDMPSLEPKLIVPGEYGVDVSHWQGEMDWFQCREAGATIAYIKATEGENWVDPRFFENWNRARQPNLKLGAYHYFRNGESSEAQARHFLHTVGDYDALLPPALDVEDGTAPPDADHIRQWLAIVEDALGVRPVIYTGAWYWNNDRFGGPVPWASEYRLWVSSYNYYAADIPTDWNTFWLWQFSGVNNKRGHIFGAQSADIDLNRAR
ncbi:MAG: glycoside hydrolase family 25 protein [Candidatus Promineifilaceae bacterium]|nr:glycoside hydrolase family 25 protein [Candidatus Promineifilaceae bacterium]